MKFCLVASSGGHLLELFSVREAWRDQTPVWVTFPTQDAKSLLKNEADVVWAHYPTNRNVFNLVKNLGLAWQLLRKERPDVIISTGGRGWRTIYLVRRLVGD